MITEQKETTRTIERIRSESANIAISVLAALIFFSTGSIFLFYFFWGKVVPPGYLGIRHNGYSIPGLIEKGYSDLGLSPGLHWRVPGFSDIVLLPRTFQFVNFNSTPAKGELSLPELDIPTKDGSKVKADITLVLRLFQRPGKVDPEKARLNNAEKPLQPHEVPFMRFLSIDHGGPRQLVEHFKADRQDQLRSFSILAQDKLNQNLSSLSTSDFYNPALRERVILRAYTQIAQAVSPSGIELWGALLRRFVYAEKNIDDQIFAKILQEQTERLTAASSRLAAAKAETEKEQALGDATIRDLEVQGDAKVQVLRSEGDLYQATKQAQGDLLVANAKAEIDAAKAKALDELGGADIYVARELAPLLRTLKGGVVTDIDPYNIKAWVEKLTSSKSTE